MCIRDRGREVVADVAWQEDEAAGSISLIEGSFGRIHQSADVILLIAYRSTVDDQEDFWVKAERLYYSALIGYIWYEATEEEKNFITLLDLLRDSNLACNPLETGVAIAQLYVVLLGNLSDNF